MIRRKICKRLVVILILISVIACSFVSYVSYSIVQRFIFRRIHNEAWLKTTMQIRDILRTELGAVPVLFPSYGNINLAGLLLIRPEARRVILLCHGYSRSKERLYNVLKLFPDDTILLFDYRAHGESQGLYSTIGFYEKYDVVAACDFLKNYDELKDLPLYGIGFSMGAVSLLGAVAMGAPFKAIIVDSPFKRLDQQVQKMFERQTGFPLFPFINISYLIFEYLCSCRMNQVDTIDWAKSVNIPVLLIHSKQDDLADVQEAYELYEAFPGIKKLWIVEGAAHARIYKQYPDDYIQHIEEFFNSVS